MTKFVPEAKMSKKARKELNAQKRATWGFSPVTKRVESRKAYNRKNDWGKLEAIEVVYNGVTIYKKEAE